MFQPAVMIGKNPPLPVGNERPSVEELQKLEQTIPSQPKHLAAIFTGNRVAQQVGLKSIEADYSDAIHAARAAAKSIGVELQLRQAKAAGFHPGRTAELLVGAEHDIFGN